MFLFFSEFVASQVQLWDLRSPGSAVCSVGHHAKTVSALSLMPASSLVSGEEALGEVLIVTASLDRTVKVHSLRVSLRLACAMMAASCFRASFAAQREDALREK